MTSQDHMTKHFQSMKGIYDNLPLCSDPKSHNHRLETILELLNLDPVNDSIVDLGAGSSQIAKIWKQRFPNAKPITCVDPSPLLPLDDPDVIPLKLTAQEFVTRNNLKYDALFVVQAFHNMIAGEDPVFLAKGIYSHLNEGGRICIATRPDTPFHFPWFQASHNTYNNVKLRTIINALREAGFRNIKVTEKHLVHSLTKDMWYHLLRRRFFSHLYLLNDEVIEEGIQELETGLLQGKKFVEVDDVFNYVTAWK